MVLRLLLAGALGGLIGYEREAHGRPAGLRTHILVCIGAAMFTIISSAYSGKNADPGRVASQIVTGIGFLGAGTIIRQGSIVRGLTTAASLWTTAAIGMAVGVVSNDLRFIYLAISASVIVFITLSLLSRIERTFGIRRGSKDILVRTIGRAESKAVIEELAKCGGTVSSVRIEDGLPVVHAALPRGCDIEKLNTVLAEMPEVRAFEWE